MRKFASSMTLLLLCALAIAQTRTITGQVKDSKGDPVPFANISIKGTNAGVSADATGNFKIDVKPGQSLVISSASFAEQEVKVGDASTIAITLQPQGNLQEVVVTALGIKRTRNQVPYAAQQISGDEVSKNRSSNFNRGWDAWIEWRKLDYPQLAPAVDALSDIPLRYPYPVNEQNVNRVNYEAAAAAIGGDLVTTKLVTW